MGYRNVAMFTKDGALKRLVCGTSRQVEENIINHTGPWAEMDLIVSEMEQVPDFETLKSEGKINVR